jgi:hypothetical protein
MIISYSMGVNRPSAVCLRLRWAAAGMVQAENQYRRVKNHRQLDALAPALDGAVHRGATAAPTPREAIA